MEPAPGRDVRRVRSLAFQDDALPPPVRVRDRHDGHERLRVRVPRILDQLPGRPFLDDLPQVHDPDSVREDPREGEVVGDEQVREAFLLAQLQEELEDLRADRDVEHRDGFVGHQELRIQDEGPRDRYALSLAPGELVRKAEQEVPRRSQPRIGERLLDPGLRFGAVPAQAIPDQRLRDDIVDGLFRVQRLVRILEDDLELLPQSLDLDPLEAFSPQPVPDEDPADDDGDDEGDEIAAERRDGLVAPNLGLIETARVDVAVTARRRVELQDHLARRRLSAPALPDETEDLPPPDVEVDRVDGPYVFRRRLPQRLEEPPALLEPHAEVAQDEVWLARQLTSPPSAAESWCSGGRRRNGLLPRGRAPAPGRRTAATRTCIAGGSGPRPAGW